MYQHEVYKRRQEEKDREELLSRRFTSNALSERDTAILIDHSLQHNLSLQVFMLLYISFLLNILI